MVPNDGCSNVCIVESGWACDSNNPTVCIPICGDGKNVGTEVCDDGNLVGT